MFIKTSGTFLLYFHDSCICSYHSDAERLDRCLNLGILLISTYLFSSKAEPGIQAAADPLHIGSLLKSPQQPELGQAEIRTWGQYQVSDLGIIILELSAFSQCLPLQKARVVSGAWSQNRKPDIGCEHLNSGLTAKQNIHSTLYF